jgi:hypothetical protein
VLRPDGKTILPLYGIQRSLAIHVENGKLTYSSLDACKPILRPLSDMTQKERKQIGPTWHKEYEPEITDNEFNTEEIRLMLSKGFDLFGLIDAGLAIDKTTLQTSSL